jgi:ABC-type transporter Mla subunit MlaD
MRIVMIGKDVTDQRLALRKADAEREAMTATQARVVDALRRGLESLADGNLTISLDEAFSDDYEQLRGDFNKAVNGLLDAMRGVIENADLIQGEASEISSAADDLSSRTERQAATLEETASALDELTSSVKSAAEDAAHANDLVESARKNAEASGEVVREAVEAMSEIAGRLAVIIVNAPEQVYPDRWKAVSNAMAEDHGSDPEMPNRRLAAILDEANIPYLDTLPPFQAAAAQPEAQPLYFRYDFHWSPAGHALAAQAVESFLRESELLGSSHGN